MGSVVYSCTTCEPGRGPVLVIRTEVVRLNSRVPSSRVMMCGAPSWRSVVVKVVYLQGTAKLLVMQRS